MSIPRQYYKAGATKLNLIVDTFVQVAPDCPVTNGIVPTVKKDRKPSIHILQYELLSQNPYTLTLEDLIYEVYIRHKEFPIKMSEQYAASIRAELFQKNHPCMRASMLVKKYGWGAHYDHEGRLALYGMETEEYSRFVENEGNQLTVVLGMRNKRA